ncbi:hypothetical protein RRG08_042101 [Elysia crispata]|uniref:C-type lectin domain-containing protein n=1 Tax=Elysia crispata TaxID=231223 RepID=A0AAE1DZ14_9GAST|nr:hypothetical protein RRG08_042101 [Elysia crispata]
MPFRRARQQDRLSASHVLHCINYARLEGETDQQHRLSSSHVLHCLNFCSSGWLQSPTSYSCIKFYCKEKSWFDARNTCQAVNGDLMINIDDMKQNWIEAQRKSHPLYDEFWIGLNDRKNEDHFKWLDGTQTISKTYWMDDQPNNWRGDQHCGAYRNPRSNIAKWNDQRCSKRLKFVCEVFPDCPGNTFGGRCTDICNQTCGGANNTCKRYDGFCINGCDIGYQGNTCDAPCENNTFGANCSETCSKTCGGPHNTCNHVNGSCIFGCVDGYQGERCEDSTNETKHRDVQTDSVLKTIAAVSALVAIACLVMAMVACGETDLKGKPGENGIQLEQLGKPDMTEKIASELNMTNEEEAVEDQFQDELLLILYISDVNHDIDYLLNREWISPKRIRLNLYTTLKEKQQTEGHIFSE